MQSEVEEGMAAVVAQRGILFRPALQLRSLNISGGRKRPLSPFRPSIRPIQGCKLKFRLRELTSCLCSAAASDVCFDGRVAGLDATETLLST